MTRSRLIYLFLFCVGMLVLRFVHTQQFTYFFLLWNLFLAVLPLLMLRVYQRQTTGLRKYTCLGLCLLFLPNAPYIVTDLFHLSKQRIAPLWLDTLLVLSFSLLGLLLFLRTLEGLVNALAPILVKPTRLVWAKWLVLLSNGYGIYLGRYLRFNSWDLVYKPVDLFRGLLQSLCHPNHYKETLAMSLTYTVFLWIIFEIYLSFKQTERPHYHELSQK